MVDFNRLTFASGEPRVNGIEAVVHSFGDSFNVRLTPALDDDGNPVIQNDFDLTFPVGFRRFISVRNETGYICTVRVDRQPSAFDRNVGNGDTKLFFINGSEVVPYENPPPSPTIAKALNSDVDVTQQQEATSDDNKYMTVRKSYRAIRNVVGQALFMPTQVNLYDAVKAIFHPSTQGTVVADDASYELDVAAFSPSQQNLYDAVKAIFHPATASVVSADDVNQLINITPNFHPTQDTVYAAVKAVFDVAIQNGHVTANDTLHELDTVQFSPTQQNIYDAVKAILNPAASAGVSADDANSQIHITHFSPTQQNIYAAVKAIFHPSTQTGVQADDTNFEIDVIAMGGGGSFSPTQQNIYNAVKAILHPATQVSVSADDANYELDIVAGGAAFNPTQQNIYDAVKAILHPSDQASVHADDANYELDITSSGGVNFVPSKANLYSAVKDILHPANQDAVDADDANNELDITRFAPTKQNIYDAVKSIFHPDDSTAVTADDAHSEIDISDVYSPSQTSIYDAVKAIFHPATSGAVTADDANHELDIVSSGGSNFAPTKANLYQAVKDIFHPADSTAVSADDANSEIDIANSFSPSQQNLYDAVKAIFHPATQSTVANDDANHLLNVTGTSFSPTQQNLYAAVKEIFRSNNLGEIHVDFDDIEHQVELDFFPTDDVHYVSTEQELILLRPKIGDIVVVTQAFNLRTTDGVNDASGAVAGTNAAQAGDVLMYTRHSNYRRIVGGGTAPAPTTPTAPIYVGWASSTSITEADVLIGASTMTDSVRVPASGADTGYLFVWRSAADGGNPMHIYLNTIDWRTAYFVTGGALTVDGHAGYITWTDALQRTAALQGVTVRVA